MSPVWLICVAGALHCMPSTAYIAIKETPSEQAESCAEWRQAGYPDLGTLGKPWEV